MSDWRSYSAGFARYRGADARRAARWMRRIAQGLAQARWCAPVPARVLDVGCGVGRFLGPLAARFGGAIGVDREAAMLARARARIGGRAGLVQADAAALPLPAASVDLVFASMLMEHVADRAAVLREFARVLRPGGAVVLRTMLPRDVQATHWYRCSAAARRLELARTPALARWQALAQAAGLGVAVQCSYRDRLDPAVAGRSAERVRAGAYEVLQRLGRLRRGQALRRAQALDRRGRPEVTGASLLVLRHLRQANAGERA